MASCVRTMALMLILLTSCLSQERGGVNPQETLPILRHALGTAHVSGSLAYWGRCDFHQPYPDFPRVRLPAKYSGPPAEVLRDIFADSPTMDVTQEPGGLIRMIEADVPRDLLDVRIRHLSFGDPTPSDMFNGPNNALNLVLSAPEVRAFRSAHHIGPFSNRWIGPGDSATRRPRVSGDLHNVTVSEALDFILKTFPGFWIYENCSTHDGEGRTVFSPFLKLISRTLSRSLTAIQNDPARVAWVCKKIALMLRVLAQPNNEGESHLNSAN